MNDNREKITPFCDGDKRINALYDALKEEIYSRAGGQMPVTTVCGVLDLLKRDLLNQLPG